MAFHFCMCDLVTSRRRTAHGAAGFLFVAACSLWACLVGAPAQTLGQERPAAYGPAGLVADPFARLRESAVASGSDAWQSIGEQLARIELLEGAVYDEESGLLVLAGKRAAGRGPYHLDDLMVALQAVYFEKEPLGMTIDPDPKDPRGPTMNVRYYGGCENSALGWIMFECDRLVKCFSQGLDNLTGQEFAATVPEFYNMLQLRAGSKQGPESTWNRFWLTLDLERGPHWHENPTRSNGYQPVVLETEDRRAMRIVHCRWFLRTEVMRLEGGELLSVPGSEDKQAERFASHFSHYYDKFAELRPEFARLRALARLLVLAEWLDRAQVPLDRELVHHYRQQVPVQTPRQTPARTNTLKMEEKEDNHVTVHEYSIYGGVDADPRTFFASDKDSQAARLAASARLSQDAPLDQWSWQAAADDGPLQMVGLPTVKTRLDQVKLSKNAVQFRQPRYSDKPAPAALPTTEIAKSERGPAVVQRAQIDLQAIDLAREKIRGPTFGKHSPDPGVDLVLADERYLPPSEHQERVELLFLHAERPEEVEMPSAPIGLDKTLLKRTPKSPSVAPGEPSSPLAADPQQTLAAKRQPVDSRPPLPLGLPVFETPQGSPTWNLPRFRTYANPRRQLTVSDPRQPDRNFSVPDQLMLQSELGDVLVRFGSPEFDATRGEFYFLAEEETRWGIARYYPERSSLEFNDGMRVKFSPIGWPQYAQMSDGSSVNFLYQETPTAEPQLTACVVSLPQTPEDSGYYRLPQTPRRTSSVVSPAPLPVHAKPDEVETPMPPLEKQEFRTWTDRTGRTVEAVLEGFHDGVAVLKTRAGSGRVPIDRLNQADQDYVRRWEESREKSLKPQPKHTNGPP